MSEMCHRSLVILVVAACAADPKVAPPDGGHHDSPARTSSLLVAEGLPSDGGGVLADAPSVDGPSYVCQYSPNQPDPGACCIFAGPPACVAGSSCYWAYRGDLEPTQVGDCLPTGSTPVGGSCTGSPNNECVDGATCAPMGGTNKTCRPLCDPEDAARHGCAVGQTCHSMPYCQPPNGCMPAARAHAGYCQ